MRVTHSGAVRIVDRLEEAGLARRESDPFAADMCVAHFEGACPVTKAADRARVLGLAETRRATRGTG